MASSRDDYDAGGGQLTPCTNGIIQHFTKKVREFTEGVDTDLQVVNENIGVLEDG